MKRLAETILFSFFVSLSMVVLDAFYHLATETAVHILYVAVKFTIIFILVFLVAYWVGKGAVDGLFTSIAGPVIFYIYYIFANPTLNRQIFKIDENFGYIFVHIAALLISYFFVYHFWYRKKGSGLEKSLAYAFVVSLCIWGLNAGYQMAYAQLTTHNEEEVARLLSFAPSIYLAGIFFALAFLSNFFIKSRNIEMILLVLGSSLAVYFMGHSMINSFAGIAAAFVPAFLAKVYFNEK